MTLTPRILAVAAITFITGILSTTQTLSQSILIPRAGLCLSSRTVDSNRDYKGIVRFALGLEVQSALKNDFHIVFGMGYVGRGYSSDYQLASNKYTSTYRTNYLAMPVMVRKYFGSSSRVYINAGPYVGFGFGGKFQFESSAGPSSDGKIKFGSKASTSETVYYDHALDFGATFGGGVKLYKNLALDARYDLGLTAVDASSYKNRSIQVALTYQLPALE